MKTLFKLSLIALVGMITSCSVDHPDGWVNLFDGKTLNGWEHHGGQKDFKVVDNCIVGTTHLGVPNGFLCTTTEYDNFELQLDFHCPPKTNSGVQIRSHIKETKRSNDVVWGYQVEIDPSERAWTAGIQEESGRGWIANLKNKPKARAAFKQNDWNHLRIVAQGDHLRTWINGVAAADFKDGKTAKGFIALQLHWPVVKRGAKSGTLVKFKNIRLKKLDHY